MARHALLSLALLLAVCALVQAECPNGCSGAGTCGAKDMCTCDKNRMGNDCSQKVCPFGRAMVDTPKGDLNMDGSLSGAGTTVVSNSQVYPEGTTELYPAASTNEGHFYMECSNAGLCNRKTGTCECFSGFAGSACHRTVCPGTKEETGPCSGHGTCESIREMAKTYSVGSNRFLPLEAGSADYNLWDANVTYGCLCDPGYTGIDCAQRVCKVGVDPMYESDKTPVYERVSIHIDGASAIGGKFRLRLFDHNGDDYVTEKITAAVKASDISDNIAAAIQRLPNSAFKDVEVAQPGSGIASDLTDIATANGMQYVIQYSNNPGKHRLLEFADTSELTDATTTNVMGTTQTGEDVDRIITKSSSVVTATTNDNTGITLDTADASLTALALIKIEDYHHLLTSCVGTACTLVYKWMGSTTSGASTSIFYNTADTVTAATGTVKAWAVGATSFTSGGDVTAEFTRGTKLFFENQYFTVQSSSYDGTTDTTVVVNRPFGGTVAAGAAIAAATDTIYIITESSSTPTYTYVDECSGRGLCGRKDGICDCFPGYTNDNCDTQNVLAM